MKPDVIARDRPAAMLAPIAQSPKGGQGLVRD